MNQVQPQNHLFWKKKTIISYFLSILVFMIHISSFAQYTKGESVVSIINEKVDFFFTESITRFAVPMFFILSGIAFFRDYENCKYINKLKSRFKTLLVPYFVWNTLWMIFDIICSYTFLSNYFIGRQKFELTFANVLESVFLHKSTPFWFIFNLIVFIVFAPLINAIIKNKKIGFATVLLLSVLLIFKIGLPELLFFSQDSIVYFLFGAIIGKHYFTCVQKKSSISARVSGAIFLLSIVVLKNVFPISSYTIKPFVQTVIYILLSISLWCLFDVIIDKLKERPLYARSFFIYAMHVNISAIITKIIAIVFPKSEWFAIPNFIITMVLTLLTINVFCIILELHFPRLYFLLSGKKLMPKRMVCKFQKN